MQTTLELLEKALSQQPAPYWTQKLNLARTTLATAKVRGHLSPSIAGALAEEMGEDYQKWFVIAALEGERDSACKSRMVRKFLGASALAGAALTAATPAVAATDYVAEGVAAVYYVKSLICRILRLRCVNKAYMLAV